MFFIGVKNSFLDFRQFLSNHLNPSFVVIKIEGKGEIEEEEGKLLIFMQ